MHLPLTDHFILCYCIDVLNSCLKTYIREKRNTMSMKRMVALVCRWSLISVLAIAGFWGVSYLITGYMPQSKLTFSWLLPNVLQEWTITRIYDCFLGPIFSLSFVLMFTCETVERINGRTTASMACGAIIAFLVGIVNWVVLFRKVRTKPCHLLWDGGRDNRRVCGDMVLLYSRSTRPYAGDRVKLRDIRRTRFFNRRDP